MGLYLPVQLWKSGSKRIIGQKTGRGNEVEERAQHRFCSCQKSVLD